MLHFVVNKTVARRKAIVREPVRCVRWRLVMPCSCWSSLTSSSPAKEHACLIYIATVDSDKNLPPSPWSHTAETVLCFCSQEIPYRRRPSRSAWQSRSRWCLADLLFSLMWESSQCGIFGWYQKHDRTWYFMDFSLTAESFFVVKSSMFLISSVELILLEHETSSSILSVCNFVIRPSTLRI